MCAEHAFDEDITIMRQLIVKKQNTNLLTILFVQLIVNQSRCPQTSHVLFTNQTFHILKHLFYTIKAFNILKLFQTCLADSGMSSVRN